MLGEDASGSRALKQSGENYRKTLKGLTPEIVKLSKETGPENRLRPQAGDGSAGPPRRDSRKSIDSVKFLLQATGERPQSPTRLQRAGDAV